MLYEMRALQQAYAAQTGLHQVLRAYCMIEVFFFLNLRVKKIKISSSCWWRFQLATSPIGKCEMGNMKFEMDVTK